MEIQTPDGQQVRSFILHMVDSGRIVDLFVLAGNQVMFECEIHSCEAMLDKIISSQAVGPTVDLFYSSFCASSERYRSDRREIKLLLDEISLEVSSERTHAEMTRRSFNSWIADRSALNLEKLQSHYARVPLLMQGLLCGFNQKDAPIRKALMLS